MQGFNMGRYYPPSTTAAPTFNNNNKNSSSTRSLRGRSGGGGALTVRFEMPFAIWCDGCSKPTLVGQGVRFNAEKRRVGQYFSTAIWSFRMRHAECGGEIEVRTDPKRGEYLVVRGGRRRDYGEDEVVVDREGEGGGTVVVDEEERRRRREDAMAGLEGRNVEERGNVEAGKRTRELWEDRERFWKDPGEANRVLRKGFRRERKERAREAEKAEAVRDRLGLDVELVPEREEDALRARLVEFGGVRDRVGEVETRPLFAEGRARESEAVRSPAPSTKKEREGRERRELLRQRVQAGTRAIRDPWSVESGRDPSTAFARVNVRKKSALVSYDSD